MPLPAPSRRAAALLWAAAALALCSVPARAAKVEVHSVTGFDKLADGDALTTGIAAPGAVVLPPPVTALASLPGGPVLAVAVDANGTVYAALSTPGRVLAVDPKGTVKTLLEASEPVVAALALDGKGALYAATSPGGAVHRVDLKTGKAELFFKPAEGDLWALAHDGTQLYVATGNPGALFRVDAKGTATRVAEKPLADKLLRSLVLLPGGKGVAVGSGRKGVLWSVDEKGNAFALYDSSLEEVTSLAVRPDGTLAAALVANEAKGSGDDELLTPSEAGTAVDDSAPRDAKASEVILVLPGGEARRVWRGKKDAAYAVAFDEKGDLLIGTGPRGRLYRVEVDSRRITLLAQSASNRITAMARTPKTVVLGLSHSSGLASVGTGLLKQGVYLAPVQDSDKTVRYGRLLGRGETPAGTRVSLSLRTGNTEKPDETWSPWSLPLPLAGGNPKVPRARFAQVKATLEGDGSVGPELRELHLAYAVDNTPPVVASVDVLAPGVRVEPMPNDEPKGRTFTVSARAFDDFLKDPLESPVPAEPAGRAKQTYESGWRTVAWHATDEDGDELRYRAELLPEHGAPVVLADGARDPFVAFQEWRFPDGAYRVRVEASDAASNPAGESRSAERTSLVFTVDRTPPVLRGKVEAGRRLVLHVEDASPVIQVSCSLDGGEPLPGAPVDGVLDGPEEDVLVALPAGLKAGKHTVACQAQDAQGNTGRVVLDLPVP